MDNLTHTVIGLVAGEAIARTTRSPRRTGLLVAAMVGSNLPDADLLVSYADGKLGYLLQHRGYTHTVLGCLVLAAVLTAVMHAWWRRRGDGVAGRDAAWLLVTSLLTVGLHLGLDALNNYGVHPFWPFDDRWYYGDALFIVEPLFWVAAAPLLLLQRSRIAKIAIGALLAVAMVINAAVHPGLSVGALYLPILVVALVAIGRPTRPRLAALTACAGVVAVPLIFVASSRLAGAQVESSARRQFPGETLIDRVLTPGPMQPACWNVLLMQREDDRYVVRQGRTVTSGSIQTTRCSRLQLGGDGTAPWQSLSARPVDEDARVRWDSALENSVAMLATRAKSDCRTSALMQFVRAPFLARREGRWILGDLRFDREPGPGFAELELETQGDARCPWPVPWIAPRAALLRGE